MTRLIVAAERAPSSVSKRSLFARRIVALSLFAFAVFVLSGGDRLSLSSSVLACVAVFVGAALWRGARWATEFAGISSLLVGITAALVAIPWAYLSTESRPDLWIYGAGGLALIVCSVFIGLRTGKPNSGP